MRGMFMWRKSEGSVRGEEGTAREKGEVRSKFMWRESEGSVKEGVTVKGEETGDYVER